MNRNVQLKNLWRRASMEEQFDLLNFSKIAHEDPMLSIKEMFSIKTTLGAIENGSVYSTIF